MVREFCRIYGLENKSRDEHYQLNGSASEALTENVCKLSETFEKFYVSFEESDNVLNLVTKAVLLDKSEKDMLERDKRERRCSQHFLPSGLQEIRVFGRRCPREIF